MSDVIKNEISAALNDVEGLVHVDVSMDRDTYATQNLLRTKHQTVGPTEGTNLDEEITATLNQALTIKGTKHVTVVSWAAPNRPTTSPNIRNPAFT